jgi:LCP family protein required for cell wall assembly
MSIPRDLYVPMPGRPARKITVAYALQESEEEGTGANYLRRTIEQNLELPVHRYIMIDIGGFERVIDELGGVEIDVPPSDWDPDVGIYDDAYPTDDCGTMELLIKPGLQQMDGTTALQYARSRHSSSDFDRSRRQIDVLMAIRRKALSPAFLRRAPGLLPALLDTVETDFTAREIMSLAGPAIKADAESIERYSIDNRIVYNDRILIDGANQSVLRLNPDAYEVLRASFLDLTAPAYPEASSGAPVPRLAEPTEATEADPEAATAAP